MSAGLREFVAALGTGVLELEWWTNHEVFVWTELTQKEALASGATRLQANQAGRKRKAYCQHRARLCVYVLNGRVVPEIRDSLGVVGWGFDGGAGLVE